MTLLSVLSVGYIELRLGLACK